MGHFKRKGPKSTRAGCIHCKPHKAQWLKDTNGARTPAEQRSLDRMEAELKALDDEEVYDED